MKKIDENKKHRVYGTIGMVALFLIGAIVGFVLNGSDRTNHSMMTQEQCERLSDKMWYAINNNNYEEISISMRHDADSSCQPGQGHQDSYCHHPAADALRQL